MAKLKVLLTGAAGRIGRHLVGPLQEAWDLRTLDRKPVPGDPGAVIADLGDRAALERAMQGIEVLVHLAAYPDEGPFLEELVPNNVVGLYHTFEAARAAGVRRMVFASTCQTVLGRKEPGVIFAHEPPQPCSLYGATKVLGEAMGRYYHNRHKLEFVAIRIGWFQPYDSESLRKRTWGGMNLWLSPRDSVKLLRCAAEKPGVGYAVVHGTSKTAVERLSLKEARELLGYEPEDDVNVLFPKE